MQIVIDIPEDVYKRTVFYREFRDLSDCVATIKALENGTSLPKGHGNLKDVDRIFNEGFPKADINAEYEENRKKYPLWRTDITGIQSILKNAPTIVEAESEDEGWLK